MLLRSMKTPASRLSAGDQSDLFAAPAALAIDRSFATASRRALDEASWLELVPGWLSGSTSVFEVLLEEVPWQQHHRRMFEQMVLEPRMTAQFRRLGDVPHRAIVDAAQALSDHYGVTYDNIWMNLYRNHDDSTGWHRDRFSCRRELCIVPVLSLGATRRFQIKPREGGASVSVTPRSGDLVVMGGRSQEDWVHCVPKSGQLAEARISVNFQSSAQAKKSL
jgi:alkylated DNA repair dioxygenase AlkB